MADINKNILDAAVLDELGQTGLVRFSGFIFEEFLRELQGPKGMATYREMSDNDPTVGGALFTFEQLLLRAPWRVDPAGTDPQDVFYADFLQSCMDDMTYTWRQTMADVFSFVRFGFSLHEIVYKVRNGHDPGEDEQGEELPKSKYSDGRIGWRRLPIRAQETVWQWEFGTKGSIQAMIQRAPPHYTTDIIPLEKSLLFRHRAYKNNPEGYSALRHAYRPWYFKKKLEVIEAIGIERDLAGLPMMKVPAEWFASDATADQKAKLAACQRLVTRVRMDEQGGLLLPRQYDEKGNELYEFSLLTTGGRRQVDTNQIIGRYNAAIATSILADLLLIGQHGAGSYALAETKLELFMHAIDGWLDSIAEVFNRYAVPRLFRLNGFPTDNLPVLAHGSVRVPDLKDLAAYVTALAEAGMLTPTPADEAALRQLADLPAANAGQDTEIGKSMMGDSRHQLGILVALAKEIQDRLDQEPDAA